MEEPRERKRLRLEIAVARSSGSEWATVDVLEMLAMAEGLRGNKAHTQGKERGGGAVIKEEATKPQAQHHAQGRWYRPSRAEHDGEDAERHAAVGDDGQPVVPSGALHCLVCGQHDAARSGGRCEWCGAYIASEERAEDPRDKAWEKPYCCCRW